MQSLQCYGTAAHSSELLSRGFEWDKFTYLVSYHFFLETFSDMQCPPLSGGIIGFFRILGHKRFPLEELRNCFSGDRYVFRTVRFLFQNVLSDDFVLLCLVFCFGVDTWTCRKMKLFCTSSDFYLWTS